MGPVSARRLLADASVGEAEGLWYELERRPTFIDGFVRVDVSDGAWPQAGSRIVWGSPPSGRGRVVERVTAHEPGRSQTASVEDGEMWATQTVRFDTLAEGCEIVLELDYRLKREGVPGVLADLIYFRRRLRASIERTLTRFAIELAAERELAS
jgi:uncharacterized membrane protein